MRSIGIRSHHHNKRTAEAVLMLGRAVLTLTPLRTRACLAEARLLALDGARVALEVARLLEVAAETVLLLGERTCDAHADSFGLGGVASAGDLRFDGVGT